ncbi:MAG: sugar nucleotide-binding protein [Erysipelotrichaceae bacterium]
MKKIVVTGSNGYIASLVMDVNKDKISFIPLYRKDVDLSNPFAVREYFSTLDFDVCFHTAANATTKICEEQPELTHRINVESSIAIADICKAKKAKLIFISTEQVFNNQDGAPFTEDSIPNSVSVYGNHKIEVEEYLKANNDDYVILRFSWMMGLSYPQVKESPNIVRNVLNAISKGCPTKFTVNECRGMTYAYNFALNFDRIIDLPTGIYHYSNINNMSTYESACYVANKLGCTNVDKYILPDYDRYAEHFRDYRLDSTKLNDLGIITTTFEDDVDQLLKDFGFIK